MRNTTSEMVWLVCSVILIPLGVLENIVSIIVLCKPRFSTMPSRLSLISLSVNDATVLTVGMGRYLFRSVTKRSFTDEIDWLCKILSYATITMSHISSSIVALVCIERLVAVVFNNKIASSYRIQIVGLYVIFLGCGCLNIHVLFTSGISNNVTDLSGCTSNGYRVALVVDCLDAIFLCVIPFIIVISCNCSIVLKLRIVSQQITSRSSSTNILQSTHKKRKSRIEKRDSKVTVTLMIVTMAFFFFNVPFGVVNFLRTYASKGDTPSDNWNMAWLITYVLVYLNNCVNLPIYTFSHTAFRQELRRLLLRRQS